MYGDSPMGLEFKSCSPPDVIINENDLKINLYVSVTFKVNKSSGEIADLFIAHFVSIR